MSSTLPNSSRIEIPDDIVSSTAKLVYMYIASVTEATVNELSDRLNMKKLALYGVLQTLAGKGYVEQQGETYTLAA